MIEVALLATSWYIIGLLSMLLIQCWIDKSGRNERKTYPGHTTPHNDIGSQEVWVLGILGPIIFAIIAYFVIVLWWVTRKEEERYENKRK